MYVCMNYSMYVCMYVCMYVLGIQVKAFLTVALVCVYVCMYDLYVCKYVFDPCYLCIYMYRVLIKKNSLWPMLHYCIFECLL